MTATASSSDRLRVLVVDDEMHARVRLQQLLVRWPDLDIAFATSGPEAVAKLVASDFDVVLLDVQMPGLDGFGVVDAVGPERMPIALVFVTAHDRFALRAFDARAIDYVMKPISQTRLDDALERARALVRAANAAKSPGSGARSPRRFLVEDGGGAILLETTRIERAIASANYVEIHVAGRSYLVRSTLAAVRESLGSAFVQVNRSEIVRIDQVRSVTPSAHGDARIRLASGAEIVWSRRYRSRETRSLFEGASDEEP